MKTLPSTLLFLALITSCANSTYDLVIDMYTKNSGDLCLIDTKSINDRGLVEELISIQDNFDLRMISKEDVNSILKKEKILDSLGCDEVSCYSEIIGGFGIQYYITISGERGAFLIKIFKGVDPAPIHSTIVKRQYDSKQLEFLHEEISRTRNRNKMLDEVFADVECGLKKYAFLEILGSPDYQSHEEDRTIKTYVWSDYEARFNGDILERIARREYDPSLPLRHYRVKTMLLCHYRTKL